MNQITEDYLDTARNVIANAKPFAGAFGMKGGINDDPCHMNYYNAMKAALEEEDADAYESVRFLLNADRSYECSRSVSFMLTAVQGLAVELVPRLSLEQKEEFRQWLDDNVPRRMRLPIQDQLYKALKK